MYWRSICPFSVLTLTIFFLIQGRQWFPEKFWNNKFTDNYTNLFCDLTIQDSAVIYRFCFLAKHRQTKKSILIDSFCESRNSPISCSFLRYIGRQCWSIYSLTWLSKTVSHWKVFGTILQVSNVYSSLSYGPEIYWPIFLAHFSEVEIFRIPFFSIFCVKGETCAYQTVTRLRSTSHILLITYRCNDSTSQREIIMIMNLFCPNYRRNANWRLNYQYSAVYDVILRIFTFFVHWQCFSLSRQCG